MILLYQVLNTEQINQEKSFSMKSPQLRLGCC
jgi:hypothetical protein